MAGKKINDLPNRTLSLADFFVSANSVNGLAGKNTIQDLLNLINPAGAPITEYTDYTALLANTDIKINFFALVIDGTDEGYTGWVLVQYKGGDRSLIGSYRVIISQDVYSSFLPLLVDTSKQVDVSESLEIKHNDGATELCSIVIDPQNIGGLGKGIYFLEDRPVKIGLLALGYGETDRTSTDGNYSDLLPTSLVPLQKVVNDFVPKSIVDGSNVVTRDQGATGSPYIYDSVTDGTTLVESEITEFRIMNRLIGATETSFIDIIEGEIPMQGIRNIGSGGVGAKMAGRVTLVAGTATVTTTKIGANSNVILNTQSLGTVARPKHVGVTARTAGTSFTITSDDATDTSVVSWEITELT